MFSTQYLWLRPTLSISGSVKLFLLLKVNWNLRAILISFAQMETSNQKTQRKTQERLNKFQRKHGYLFTNVELPYPFQGHMLLVSSLIPIPPSLEGRSLVSWGNISSEPLHKAGGYCQSRNPVHPLPMWQACEPTSLLEIQIMCWMTEKAYVCM